MTKVNDSQLPKVAATLLGGPLEGQRFKVPLFPPANMVPESLDLPLKQPGSSSPFALYKLSGDQPVGGYYVYFFAGCSSPDGDGVLYAPTFSEAGAGVHEQAGVLDLASQLA